MSITFVVSGIGFDISPPGMQIYFFDYWLDIEVFNRGGFSIIPHYKFEQTGRSLIVADDKFSLARN